MKLPPRTHAIIGHQTLVEDIHDPDQEAGSLEEVGNQQLREGQLRDPSTQMEGITYEDHLGEQNREEAQSQLKERKRQLLPV